MMGYNLLWITSVLLSIVYLRQVDSFQCYECENCPTIGLGDMKYLKECRIPGAQQHTAKPTSSEEEDSQGENISDENEDIFIPNVPDKLSATSTSTTFPTTSKSKSTSSVSNKKDRTTELPDLGSGDSSSVTSSTEDTSQEKKKNDFWSFFPHSIEEEDLIDSRPIDDVLNEERMARAEGDLPGIVPMCYVLRIEYEGYEVTNRGCGQAVSDKNITCKMLAKGQSYSECRVCEGDMCNKASRLRSVVNGTLYVLVMIVVYSW